MTNVEVLSQLGILQDVRQRLGAKYGDDEKFDKEINEMTPHEIVKEWCGWELGDVWWWKIMKSYFDVLTENQKEGQL